MTLSTFVAILSVTLVCVSTDENPSVLAFKQLNKKLSESYDKSISPKLGEETPLDVGITLYVMDFGFCSKDKELSIDMYFRQSWNDPRLELSESAINVTGGQDLADKLYIPDTFFHSVSSIKSMKYPTPNIFARVSPNGDILLSQRYQATIRCLKLETNLSKDSRIYNCPLVIESYGHSSVDILYKWAKGNNDSIKMIELKDQRDFEILEAKAVVKTTQLRIGNYSSLEAQFAVRNTNVRNHAGHFGF